MLFAREKKTEDWTLGGTAVLSRPLPAIARDADGYAIAVSTTDPTLLLRPDVVGATHAAVVDDGPTSPAAAVIAAGPQTTGLYAAQAARAAAERTRGLQYQWLLQGASWPQIGLRLADGSALILYGMYLNTTNEHPNLVERGTHPVPAAFAPLLAAPTEIGYHAVFADWAYQFAAIDPPADADDAKLDHHRVAERPKLRPRLLTAGPGGPRGAEPPAGLPTPRRVASWRPPGYGRRAAPPTRW